MTLLRKTDLWMLRRIADADDSGTRLLSNDRFYLRLGKAGLIHGNAKIGWAFTRTGKVKYLDALDKLHMETKPI